MPFPICRAAIALSLLSGLALSAARADDIPAFKVLTCEKDCPNTIPARLLDAPKPYYPIRFTGMNDLYVEAMVDVDYTIAPDGSVGAAAVENLIGPPEFADSALLAVKARKYTPAYEGGKPVEENHRVRFLFQLRDKDAEHGGRPDVVSAYNSAMRLASGGKPADALAALGAIAARPALSFYERTLVAYAQAVLDAQTGATLDGRDAIRVATISEGHFLDKRSLDNALRLRIRFEAATGEFAESFVWLEILGTRKALAADDPEQKLVDKLHAMIAAPAPLAMPARIPPGGLPAFWQHTLLRRSFEFHDVAGKLDKFELRCDRHGILSPISEKAAWTVPASWSGCYINVFGAPDTKFQFVEFAPGP
jgi:hypothetical protein